jgi:hypothetical protein
MTKIHGDRGTSLVEALVAALIMTTGVVTMAQLFSIATATNLAARRNTVATILAEQKLEQLRALAFGYDLAGGPVTDLSSDTTMTPEAGGGTGLQTSPTSSLQQNAIGFVDHIDDTGRIVGRGAQPPVQAVFTRRWSIEPVSADPESALVIQVLVTASHGTNLARGNLNRLRGDARVVTVRARKAQ